MSVNRRPAGAKTLESGVFILTSTIPARALKVAKSIERVVSLERQRLTEVMLDFEEDDTMRPVRILMLDADHFDEEERSSSRRTKPNLPLASPLHLESHANCLCFRDLTADLPKP